MAPNDDATRATADGKMLVASPDGDTEQRNVRERIGDEREAPQHDKDAKRGRQDAHERAAGKRPRHELVLED